MSSFWTPSSPSYLIASCNIEHKRGENVSIFTFDHLHTYLAVSYTEKTSSRVFDERVYFGQSKLDYLDY